MTTGSSGGGRGSIDVFSLAGELGVTAEELAGWLVERGGTLGKGGAVDALLAGAARKAFWIQGQKAPMHGPVTVQLLADELGVAVGRVVALLRQGGFGAWPHSRLDGDVAAAVRSHFPSPAPRWPAELDRGVRVIDLAGELGVNTAAVVGQLAEWGFTAAADTMLHRDLAGRLREEFGGRGLAADASARGPDPVPLRTLLPRELEATFESLASKLLSPVEQDSDVGPPGVVIIDGMNVALVQCDGAGAWDQLLDIVDAAEDWFQPARVIVYLDASFRPMVRSSAGGDAASELAAELAQADTFFEVPSGTPADVVVLLAAERLPDAVIVTNDAYRDHMDVFPWLRSTDRLVGVAPIPGAGWIFPPRRPYRQQP